MTEQQTIKVKLGDANHLICYQVTIPKIVRNPRCRKVFIKDKEQLRDYASKYIQSGQKIALLLPDEGSFEDVVSIIDDQYELLVIGEKTMMATAESVGMNVIKNIRYHSNVPWITDYNKPLKGVPAFIVYSGYSLDKNIDLLKSCQKHGVIVSTPTPYRALNKFGIVPDVLICLENRDQSALLKEVYCGIYVVDMTSPLENWRVARSDYMVRMLQPDLAYLRYGLDAGTIPIGNGGFVGSVAINLAYLWGADPIVLVGFDLALTDGFPCTRHIGSDTVVTYEDQFAIFNGSHIAACGSKKFWTEIEADGGSGMVRTTYERLGYKRYLEKITAHMEESELINATEGGARIAGWTEKSFLETLKMATWHSKIHQHESKLMEQSAALESRSGPVSAGIETIERIKRECRRIIEIGSEDMTPDNELEMRELARNEPIIYTLMAPRFVLLRHSHPTQIERIQKSREITIVCANKLLEMLED